MHPLLEKFMMVGFMVAGLCTGAYLFRSGLEKTLEDLLEEDNKEILNLEAKKEGDEGYEDWEHLAKKLTEKENGKKLNEFLGETIERPGYEKTIEKLQDKCGILLYIRGSRGSRDYENAKLFCTEYVEEVEGVENYV